MSDPVKVWCASCDRHLWISPEGETQCPCGVRHTLVKPHG